jgi:outer membrane receptor protein involved in Fe transport
MSFLLALCCLVSGHVLSSAGAPVAHAAVDLSGTSIVATRTDAAGAFSVRIDPGTYHIHARAPGYAPTYAGPIVIDHDARIDVSLESLDSTQLRLIGSVRVDGKLALQRDAVPSINVSRNDMEILGLDRITQGLLAVPSVTFARPDGGGDTTPSLVALRGPDPSETLVALDGQIVNDANTGDLDLSRFPVAAFSNVAVTEGLGPSDSEGSNTIGGAVNIISLRPTREAHSAFSLSTGSFGRNEAWYNTTGTRGRLGYALALDDQQEHGYVDQFVTWCNAAPPADPCSSAQPLHIGSAVNGHSILANTTWTFSQQADISLRVFTLGNSRDVSGALSTPADATAQGSGDPFLSPGPSNVAQHIRAYMAQGRSPFGAGSLVYNVSASNNDVAFASSGPGVSPYDVTHRDKRSTVSLQWERDTEKSELAMGGYLRWESFAADFIEGGALRQNISSYFLRGAIHPNKRLRLQGGVYVSNYSTFGSNLDGRIAANYDVDENSVIRASIGTGFRAPLLAELYEISPNQYSAFEDGNCVVAQGNPNERPEHATEYELGYARKFGETANLDVSLYRTNLRDPIEIFYPLANTGCPPPNPPFFAYPINVGNAVYQGAEIRYAKRFDPHLFLNASYGLNVAYPANMPAAVANPTSGGDLVAGQQFLNIPQQQGSLTLSWHNAGWHAGVDTVFRGKNNELNRGAFALLDAAIGRQYGNMDVTLAGTNLTNAVAGKFTLPGMGVPYNGVAGALPTDLYSIEPAAVRAIMTVRF